MSKKLNFLGAFVRYYDGRMDNNGQDSVRIHMSCDLTSRLAKELGVEDILEVDSITTAEVKLKIEEIPLSTINLAVRDLEQHELSCNAHKAADFAVVRKDTEGHVERELRFKVITPGETVTFVRDYWSKIGSGPGKLTATTLAEAEQGSLAVMPPAQQQRLDGGEDTVTSTGPKRGRPRKPKTPTGAIASAKQMETDPAPAQ